MNDHEFALAHDRWLADYRRHETEAYCENETCDRYGEPVPVTYESEYGQGSIEPEDCRSCGAGLTLDAPPEIEEEDA